MKQEYFYSLFFKNKPILKLDSYRETKIIQQNTEVKKEHLRKQTRHPKTDFFSLDLRL